MWYVWEELVDYDKVSYTTLKMLAVIAITQFLNWVGFTAHIKETYNRIKKEEEEANAVAAGVANGVAGGAADGVAGGVADDSADGIADGVADGVAEGSADGAVDGVADGVAEGVADGTADGAAGGVAGGVADGAAGGAVDSSVDSVADDSVDGSAGSPRSITETTTTNSSNSIKQYIIITVKMIVEMLQKFVIMISLIILTENTLKQWLCEPFLSIIYLAELRSIPNATKKMYQIMFGEEEPEDEDRINICSPSPQQNTEQGPELGEVNENQDPRVNLARMIRIIEDPGDLPVPSA